MRKLVVGLLCAGLAACATAPKSPVAPPRQAVISAPRLPEVAAACVSPYAPAQEDVSKRGDYVAGGLYRPTERDRVPGAIPDVACIPEPQVVALPRSKVGNRPAYSVLDREYRVLGDTRGFVEEGLASYYGEKFHGRRTSNLEVYDMYAFSAAHKTLPLPSFARVTSLDTGRSVVVRVNDRGPFHDGRVMDLSLAAAVKLGIYPRGTGRVRVEALQPGDAPGSHSVAQASPAPRDLADGARVIAGAGATASDSRYAMQPATNNAAQFDGWMQQRGVRIATGHPMPVVASGAAPMPGSTRGAGAVAVDAARGAGSDTSINASSRAIPAVPFALSSSSSSSALPSSSLTAGTDSAFPLATDPVAAIATPLPLPTQPSAPLMGSSAPARALSAGATIDPANAGTRPTSADTIVLQVASFATRDNAERARTRLQLAGIHAAQVVDATVDGQTVWRLRVGPLSAQSETALITQLAGLGFNSPRRAHD